jgi:hypothetical protein
MKIFLLFVLFLVIFVIPLNGYSYSYKPHYVKVHQISKKSFLDIFDSPESGVDESTFGRVFRSPSQLSTPHRMNLSNLLMAILSTNFQRTSRTPHKLRQNFQRTGGAILLG